MKKLGYMIVGNYYQIKEECVLENDVEDELDDIKELEVEDVIQAVHEFIKEGNKSIIQFIRELVQKGCLD